MPEADVLRRLDKVEAEVESLERLWRSSVDDIKNTIKGEVRDLKTEQIAEIRKRQDDETGVLREYDKRLRDVENAVRDWNTGRGVVNWMIRTAFAIIGAGAAILGYETLGRH